MGKRNKKDKDKKRKKRNKRANKRSNPRNKNTRTDRGGGSSSSSSYGTPRSQNSSSSSSKSKKKNKNKGKGKTKKEGRRIVDELKAREDKGNKKAKEIKNKKNERSPKNLGRDGERGEGSRKDAQKRNNALVKSAVNKALEQQELVNSKRFGPLEEQYTAAMQKLGDVSGINEQLAASIRELKISNARDREAFNNESQRNQDLINTMQADSRLQIESMQQSAAEDRALYSTQVANLNSQYAQQNQMVAEQQRLQQVQAKKAQNLANAYVPRNEKSLGSVSYGDNRKKKRKAKDNRLSDLRVNSQVGAISQVAGQALAGLQLA